MTEQRAPGEKICIRCGRCLAECPVYEATGSEAYSPRGKVALINALKAGQLDPSRYGSDLLSQCLLCGRCAPVCTSQVAIDRLVREARGQGWSRGGRAWLKKVLARDVLARPGLQRGLSGAGRSWGSFLPEDSGLRLRLPPGAVRLPVPQGRTFVSGRDLVFPGPAGSPRAVLFVGCLYNHVWPRVARQAVRLLRDKCTLIVPAGQVCCGLAAASAGDEATARRLARANLAALEAAEPDVVLTLCASCGHQLSVGFPEVSGPESAATHRLAAKVIDAAAWLADRMARPQAAPDQKAVTAAYHRPCHLPADQAAKVERFLRGTPGLSLAVLPDQCCGHGGLFRVFHPRTSAAIRQDRLAAVEADPPDLVLTNCSGCAWQLWEGLSGSGTKVRHPLEVAAERIGEGS